MLAFATPTPISLVTVQALSLRSPNQNNVPHTISSCNPPHHVAVPRRRFGRLMAAMAAGLTLPDLARSVAADVSTNEKLTDTEESDAYGYAFKVPENGWTRTTGSLSSFRLATVYLCDEDKDSNVSMVVTPVPGDFRKLTSFGTMDNVLDTMVPRGKKGIDGTVISSRMDPAKNAYVVEYTISTDGLSRHLVTIFSLQPGRYLLTLTGQAREENWKARESVLRAIADSYTLEKMD